MQNRRFRMLVDQLVRGVETGRRRLRDIGDALAQKAPLHIGGGVHEVDPVKLHPTRRRCGNRRG